ncbi:MAG: DUF6089 family protein [Bacteroidia bacterium]
MKKLILFCTFSFVVSVAFSQYKWEVGGGLGAANYLGEMGGKEKTRRNFIADLKLSQTRTDFAGFVRYKVRPDVYLKACLSSNTIAGADSLSKNPARVGRNLSFKNNILEASITGQYVFYDIADLGRTYRYRNDFKAYIFTGVAGGYSNPKAKYDGSWVALSPLHTEGEGLTPDAPKPYSHYILAIPAGAGFFFTFSKKFRVGWEFNWRTSFTDYLDDVSSKYVNPAVLNSTTAVALANRNPELQPYVDGSNLPPAQEYYPGEKRGDPKHKDSYLSTSINFSYVIKTKSKFAKNKYKSFFGKQYKKGRTIRAKF